MVLPNLNPAQRATMPHIDYYFTTLSPWSYLAGLRMEDIARRHGASAPL